MKPCPKIVLDMNTRKNLTLEIKNDACFLKLIKQAPIYTIMLLHEQLKVIESSTERYSIIRDIINRHFGTNFSTTFLQHQIEFFSSSDLFHAYLTFSVDVHQLIADYQKLNSYSIIFTTIQPMSRKCIICKNNDNALPVFQSSKTFLFNENTLEQCIVLYSYCKVCKWSYYPSSYSQDTTRKKCVERQSFSQTNLFYFGGECIYSNKIFRAFSSALICMHASFHGFVKNYNKLFTNNTPFTEKRLDEKQFQINWIIFMILKLLFLWHDKDVIEIPYSLYNRDEVNLFFDQHKSELYSCFVRYWSSCQMHKSTNCTDKCTDIMVIDGHQKTARTTCKFSNCYDNTIEELGPVLVGCPRSPSTNISEYIKLLSFLILHH